MRIVSLFAALGLAACAAAPVPEANGYDVQLYFEGAPIGSSLPVGQLAEVTVHRIQQQTDRCSAEQPSCDPTAETPIMLISAACDDPCTVTAAPASGGYVALHATAQHAGATTLRVSVRSQIDGSEWNDAYPLVFK